MDIRKMTWDEVNRRLATLVPYIDREGLHVYGIPRGGMILTAFLKNATAVQTPEEADVFLDDIVDSGKTRSDYLKRFPQKPFYALCGRRNVPFIKYPFELIPEDQWVVFPWERDDEPQMRDRDCVLDLKKTAEKLRDTLSSRTPGIKEPSEKEDINNRLQTVSRPFCHFLMDFADMRHACTAHCNENRIFPCQYQSLEEAKHTAGTFKGAPYPCVDAEPPKW